MKIKILISIIITTILFLTPNIVKASDQFFEGDYIPNIWINKEKNGKIRYQQARFLRRASDQKESYCIEPWEEISNSINYTDLVDVNSITDASWKKMSLYAYYGYGYKNHTESKWYYITQLLIWREADPLAKFYFTDKLNGKKIDIFTSEIEELESWVANHEIKPDFKVKEIEMLLGTQLTLIDQSGVFYSYTAFGENHVAIEKTGSKMIVTANTIGNSFIKLTKRDPLHKSPPLIYRHPIKQDLLTAGYYEPVIDKIPVKVIGGNITIKKVDSETSLEIPQGDASLLGSTFEIHNEKGILIHKETLSTSTTISLKNLPKGTYYIKEITPGKGYQLNEEIKIVNITQNNNKVLLLFENKVIEKEITIQKYYGSENSTWQKENGIEFEFYYKDKLLISKVTDAAGLIQISLPYGIYLVKQKTTKEGYKMVEDFYIEITEKDDTLYFEKKNEKIKEEYTIEVPNTSSIKIVERTCTLYDPKNYYYSYYYNKLPKY